MTPEAGADLKRKCGGLQQNYGVSNENMGGLQQESGELQRKYEWSQTRI